MKCPNIFQLPEKGVTLIKRIKENWRVELMAWRQILTVVNIYKEAFSGENPKQHLVIAMIPVNYKQTKCNEGYKFTKLQKMINHLIYRDDIKIFGKIEKKKPPKNKLQTEFTIKV